MFAGIVRLDGSETVPDDLRAELRGVLSRRPEAQIREAGSDHAFFVRSHTGSLTDYDGVMEVGPGKISMLAGEPLSTQRGARADHEALVRSVWGHELSAFRDARGVFCGFAYSEDDQPRLVLFSDKLGIRPLYFWSGGNTVVVASALRILEGLSIVPRRRNDLGVAQRIDLGRALGSKTRYDDIRMLRSAEVLRFSATGEESACYQRWDQVPSVWGTEEEERAEAYRIFREAVKIRLGSSSEAVGHLSGGMDSRAVIAVLMELGATTDAVTFFLKPMQQDRVLAEMFSQVMGCGFHPIRLEVWPEEVTHPSLNFVLSREVDEGRVPLRPRSVWTGDGGSLGVGSAGLDTEMVGLLRSGRPVDALRRYQEKKGLGFPWGLIRRGGREEIAEALRKDFLAELGLYTSGDPGQDFLLLLMTNFQRRNLAMDYEDLDLHGLEYQMPFYDSVFLEFVLGMPLEDRLYHRFYTKWFDAFPDPVRQVPYQTYPGHVPCPLPAPKGTTYQWAAKSVPLRERWVRGARSGWAGLKLAVRGGDLDPVSSPRLAAASLLQMSGIRDYGYLMKAATAYAKPVR
jgi:hypothetical protein